MKLSAFLLSYDAHYRAGMSSRQIVDKALSQGFQAIEPFSAPDLVTVAQAADLGQYVRDQGSTISCYSICADLVTRDRDTVLADMKNRIDMAAAMGSPYYHHTIFPRLSLSQYGDASYHEIFRRAMQVLPELCSYAQDKGVLCIYEEQGLFFNGCNSVLRLTEALGDAPFGLVADLGNILFVDERPESFIGLFADKIVHVHCKDYLLKSGNEGWPGREWYMTRSGNFLRETIPGHGIIEYQKVFRLLQQIQYKGWYSVEYSALEPHDIAIPLAMENLQRIYDQVHAADMCTKDLI